MSRLISLLNDRKSASDINEDCIVWHADLYGDRQSKYETLADDDVTTTNWTRIEPRSPWYLFLQWDNTHWDEYFDGWQIDDIFVESNVGIAVGLNEFAVGFEKDEILAKMMEFRRVAS